MGLIPLPMIDMRSQRAMLGTEYRLGRFEIHTQPAEIRTKIVPPKMENNTPPPEFKVDMTTSRETLWGNTILDVNLRIYSQVPDFVIKKIRQMAQEGQFLADIPHAEDPIAKIAWQSLFEDTWEFEVFNRSLRMGQLAEFEFKDRQLDLEIEPGRVEYDVTIHKPEITYHRGYVRYYMIQQAYLEILPPKINLLA